MTPAVSFMVRHALGVAAAAVAILPMPYLASRVSWGLSVALSRIRWNGNLLPKLE
jgi:hypothetical protein